MRDATLYFILMFVCQLVLEFFLLFAPVGAARSIVPELQLCSPSLAHTLLGGDPAHARSVSFPMAQQQPNPVSIWVL